MAIEIIGLVFAGISALCAIVSIILVFVIKSKVDKIEVSVQNNTVSADEISATIKRDNHGINNAGVMSNGKK